VIETHEHKGDFKDWLAANLLNFSKHKQQNDGAHRGGDKLADEPIRDEMQQPKDESAQHRTDDPDDQKTDNSLAFPFHDQACEPASHQTNHQEPKNFHQPLHRSYCSVLRQCYFDWSSGVKIESSPVRFALSGFIDLNAVHNAAVIYVYDEAGNVIETHQHKAISKNHRMIWPWGLAR
jgi:hypothetical protein